MKNRGKVDNLQIVPYALYTLGGGGVFIDVEEIFEKCFRLFPERFRWRKYDYPNYKTLSKALRDIEGRHPELLLKTDDGLARQLSAEGVEWVERQLDLFQAVAGHAVSNPPTRMSAQRILNELRDHPLAQKILGGREPELTRSSVSDMLACAPDSPVRTWKERMESYRSAARLGGRPELLSVLDFVASQKPEWFKGEEK